MVAMRNAKLLDPEDFVYGSESAAHFLIKAYQLVGPTSQQQIIAGYRTGFETARDAQQGLVKPVFAGNLGGGLRPRADIAYFASDAGRSFVRCEGIQDRKSVV